MKHPSLPRSSLWRVSMAAMGIARSPVCCGMRAGGSITNGWNGFGGRASEERGSTWLQLLHDYCRLKNDGVGG